jgi:dsRNA-specific ribonuclease
MKDSVELCQREGRARQADCAFVVMEQRRDRHIDMLRNVQRTQESIIRDFDPKSAEETRQKNSTAHSQRQVGANRWLQQCDDSNYLQVLNMYRQKTKAHLDESSSTTPDKIHYVKLVYSSICLTIDAEGHGTTKKSAKQSAAQILLVKLKQLAAPGCTV